MKRLATLAQLEEINSAIRRDPFIDICGMAEKYYFVLAECYDEVGDSFDEDTSF